MAQLRQCDRCGSMEDHVKTIAVWGTIFFHSPEKKYDICKNCQKELSEEIEKHSKQ